MLRRKKQAIALALASVSCCALLAAQPKTIYVNNVVGSDSSSGLTPIPGPNGPMRTLSAAISLAVPRDTISVATTGAKYVGPTSPIGQVVRVNKSLVFDATSGVPEIDSLAISVSASDSVLFTDAFRIRSLTLGSGKLVGASFIRLPASGIIRRSNGELDDLPTLEGPYDLEYIGSDKSLGKECPSVESNLLRNLIVNMQSLQSRLYLTRDIAPAYVTLTKGIVVTGEYALQLASPPWPEKGFTGASIVSYIVGKVRRIFTNTGSLVTSSSDRAEFPVGSFGIFRPLIIQFKPRPDGIYTTPNGVSITVSYTDSMPSGKIGLPITNGVSPGLDVRDVHPFFWSVVSDSNVSIVCDLEVQQGKGLIPSEPQKNLRILARAGSGRDSTNTWSVVGRYGSQIYQISEYPVKSLDNTIELRKEGQIFTLGRSSDLRVENTLPNITFQCGMPAPQVKLSRFFTGVRGSLSYSIYNSERYQLSSTLYGDTLTLFVTAVRTFQAYVEVTAIDSYDGAQVVTRFEFFCFSSGTRSEATRAEFSTKDVTFGAISIGQYRDTLVAVGNKGFFALNVVDIVSTNPEFSANPRSGDVYPCHPLEIRVRFQPTQTAERSANLVFYGTAPSLPDTVRLRGTGIAATAVKEEIPPREFFLAQNYPNPFNASTRLEFQVPSSAFVTLKIFDVLGREVATLVDEEKLPGTHNVSWDASALPSGVYLYRLRAGKSVAAKTMLLLK